MQFRDPNTTDTTQHTRLGEILDDENGTQDFVQWVSELSDRECEESLINEEYHRRCNNICCEGHPGEFRHGVRWLFLESHKQD